MVNRSFKRFALSAEKEETVAQWLEAAEESNWKYVRIPIVTLVLVLFGVLAYSVTDAIESVMAIMTGVLGIFPLLLRNFSAVRGVEVDTE
jgi:hypothetical protein